MVIYHEGIQAVRTKGRQIMQWSNVTMSIFTVVVLMIIAWAPISEVSGQITSDFVKKDNPDELYVHLETFGFDSPFRDSTMSASKAEELFNSAIDKEFRNLDLKRLEMPKEATDLVLYVRVMCFACTHFTDLNPPQDKGEKTPHFVVHTSFRKIPAKSEGEMLYLPLQGFGRNLQGFGENDIGVAEGLDVVLNKFSYWIRSALSIYVSSNFDRTPKRSRTPSPG